ncbi:7058_t:CDS:2, partial [Entrophospora sp. SA101]
LGDKAGVQLSRSVCDNIKLSFNQIGACVEAYQDMAARHRARFSSIQILRIAEIKTSQVKRPYIKQLLEKNLRFPLPHRVMRSERKTKFLAKRPSTFY